MLPLLSLLIAPAQSASPEVWAALHNGRMGAALEQDPAQTAAIYEVLLEHLTKENEPLRDELLFWLGQARFEAGNIEGAIEALSEARSPEAAALLEMIQVWDDPVRTLPYVSTEPVVLSTDSSWRLMLDGVDPEVISIRLRADEGAALLQLSLTDLEGRRWEQELLEIADGEWQEMTLNLADLRPAGDTVGPPRGGLWMMSISPAAPLQGPLRIAEVELN
ncbi:MAG: hypothetical protein ACI8RZ_000006 [Myxococcota bacterium]